MGRYPLCDRDILAGAGVAALIFALGVSTFVVLLLLIKELIFGS